MPFNYPATEVFNELGERVVVWSKEEYDQAIEAGLTDAPPELEEPEPETEPVKARVTNLNSALAARARGTRK